jgi:hypothetical protein
MLSNSTGSKYVAIHRIHRAQQEEHLGRIHSYYIATGSN